MNLDTERLYDALATGHFFAPWLAIFLSNLAAVAMAPDALLVQRRDGIELRTWDRWAKGEVFASWPLPSATNLEGSRP